MNGNKKEMECYRVFDLNLRAEFPIPAFEGTQIGPEAPIDLEIRNGHVPEKLSSARKTGVCYQLGPNALQLNVPGIARYLAREGLEIIVDPEPQASLDAVRSLLVDGPLSGILHQLGRLPFYGGAFVADDHAVMICGISGTGKSTILRELINRDYFCLSDDLAVIAEKEGSLYLLSGYPSQRLSLETLKINGMDADQFPPVRPGIQQHLVPIEQKAWCNHSLPLKAVVVLSTWNQDEIESKSLDPDALKFNLLHNAMHRQYLSGMGCGFSQFKMTADLMDLMPVTHLGHSGDPKKIHETVDRILEVLAP